MDINIPYAILVAGDDHNLIMREEDFQEIMRVQQMMSRRLMQEQQDNRKIDIINIVNELTDGGKKRTQVEAVIIEARANDITESQVIKLLDELVTDHVIKLNNGMIYRI